MENYLLALAVATVAPGLVVSGVTAGLSGIWYLSNRAIFGKKKTEHEESLERLDRLEKEFEERMLEMSNREKNIDFKLDQLLKRDYQNGE